MDERRIGDLLVEAGVITRDELESALRSKPHIGERRVLSELYAMGRANERQLADVLARRLGSPVAVLTESVIDLEVVKLVPAAMLRKHMALPIACDERSVTVVTADLEAPGLLVPLGFATGRRVVPLLGIHAVLAQFIEAALQALAAGELVLVGPKASGRTPLAAVARYAPAVDVAEANALAKQIVDALSWEDKSIGTRIGAVRLKQMVIERPSDASDIASIEERSRVVYDEPPPPQAAPVAAAVPEAVVMGEVRPVALVVDDDAGIRTLLAKALEHDGLTVFQAKNGEEAVTFLRGMRPSVVLLDAMLPVVHGFEICASLKRSQLHSIPVIMISAVYRGWEQAREIQEVHGADYFVEKPFELTYVRRLVADVLKRPSATFPKVAGAAERIDALKQSYNDLAQRGLFFSADAAIEQWIDLDPFDGRAWLERGNLCAHAGDLVGAMSAYEAAVVYESTLLVAHLGLAMVYEQLGFLRRARTTWLKARELSPDPEVRSRIDRHLAPS